MSSGEDLECRPVWRMKRLVCEETIEDWVGWVKEKPQRTRAIQRVRLSIFEDEDGVVKVLWLSVSL